MLDLVKKVWAAWKWMGRLLGDIVGRVVLSVLYFTLVMPFAIGVRLTSDPLALKPPSGPSFWNPRPEFRDALEEARRQ